MNTSGETRRLLRTASPPPRGGKLLDGAAALVNLALAPTYRMWPGISGAPGLEIRRRCTSLGLRQLLAWRDRLPMTEIFKLLVYPMDSVRYFEFEFAWHCLREAGIEALLDVSSPRLLPLLMIESRTSMRATLLNPDKQDLPITRLYARAMNLEQRCTFSARLIGDLNLAERSLDAITSISVLEHIPADRDAVRKMWSLLKPGGSLVLTLPCAARAAEEYIDKDQYGVLTPDADGVVFWQRYYDEALLQERIFSETGAPSAMRVYGEVQAGSYARNVETKMRQRHRYAFWREPYMMSREYRYFDSVGDLPGMGVVGLHFRKS